jgi:AAA ATPase domain
VGERGLGLSFKEGCRKGWLNQGLWEKISSIPVAEYADLGQRHFMVLDRATFRRACDPSKTLVFADPEDQRYYIDFASVRGSEIIEELKGTIVDFYDEPTCALFTGHIGCGKSTELLRLKAELEDEGFHVVYFESSDDLEMADVDIGDVLLAIARRISESLEEIELAPQASGFKGLLEATKRVLFTDVDVATNINLFGNKLGVDSAKKEVSLSAGIAELTVTAKNDQTLRERLNLFLAPQKSKLLESINEELIEPAIAKLQQAGRRGLVVIVDNLDRIDNRPKASGLSQQAYLFVEQSQWLILQCHLVYTMPLALKFSVDYETLKQRFREEPKMLPMVPVQLRDGSDCVEGIDLLRQMVLARAFPTLLPEERLVRVTEVFDGLKSLDRLCRITGGHVRDLLRLLSEWISKGKQLPLSGEVLERLIRANRNDMTMQISSEEWVLLRQVRQARRVGPDPMYQTLIRRRLVFEYRDDEGSWFDVNPLLIEVAELQL